MSEFRLEIVTPERTVVNADVEMAVCPGLMGEFGVMPNHVNMLAALKTGVLRYRINSRDEHVFISGGFVDMNNNVLSVLAESAERAGSIDRARAERAKERAERRLAERGENVDIARADAALQRALMRIHASGLV